jgi:hypothetical protein
MGNASSATPERRRKAPTEKLINDREALLTDQEPSHPEIADRPWPLLIRPMPIRHRRRP